MVREAPSYVHKMKFQNFFNPCKSLIYGVFNFILILFNPYGYTLWNTNPNRLLNSHSNHLRSHELQGHHRSMLSLISSGNLVSPPFACYQGEHQIAPESVSGQNIVPRFPILLRIQASYNWTIFESFCRCNANHATILKV